MIYINLLRICLILRLISQVKSIAIVNVLLPVFFIYTELRYYIYTKCSYIMCMSRCLLSIGQQF